MRHVKWIFVVLLICSLTAFMNKGTATSGLSVGCVAPDFIFKSTQANQQPRCLSDLHGQYVLLNFWASYDAQSRAENILLNNCLRSQDSPIKMVSISFDKYQSVFRETVRKDQIVASVCYNELSGNQSPLFDTYRLSRGFCNYLIDANGVIIAKNISATELSEFLKNSGQKS